MLNRQLAINSTNVDPLHIEAWIIWVPLCMWHIQLNILNGRCLYFDYNVTYVSPEVQLLICNDWFRHRLGTILVTSRWLKQWRSKYLLPYGHNNKASMSKGICASVDQRKHFSLDVEIPHSVGTQRVYLGLLESVWTRVTITLLLT